MLVRAHDGRQWNEAKLHNVHHKPGLHCATNLFSLGHAMDQFGYDVRQTTTRIFVNDAGICCLTGDRTRGSLWVLRLKPYE